MFSASMPSSCIHWRMMMDFFPVPHTRSASPSIFCPFWMMAVFLLCDRMATGSPFLLSRLMAKPSRALNFFELLARSRQVDAAVGKRAVGIENDEFDFVRFEVE